MFNKKELYFGYLLIVLLVVSFVLLSYVSIVIFHDYPNCSDEHSYISQARIFAKGQLFQSIAKEEESLKDFWMLVHDGKLFSKYPPGFSLFLSLGVLIGWPGLINPFLSVVTLFFVYQLARTFVKPSVAFLTTFLLAFNTYFIGYGASYFAHAMTLTIIVMALYFLRQYELSSQSRFVGAIGALIGLCILVRPIDAFCFFLFLSFGVMVLVIKTRKWKDLILLMIGPIVGVALLVSYNYVLTQKIQMMTYSATYIKYNKSVGLWQNFLWMSHDYVGHLKSSIRVNLGEGFVYKMGILFVIFAFFGLLSRKMWGWRYLACIAIFLAVYNLSFTQQWSQYGTRYWYPLIGPIAILVALGLDVLSVHLPRYVWIVLVVLCLTFQMIHLKHDLMDYSKRFNFIETVIKDIHEHCPDRSIVILEDPKRWKAHRFIPWKHFHKNFVPSESRLFVYSQEEAGQLLKLYPERLTCRYNFSAVSK